jgi:type VI secretion system protein ImpM
MHRDNLPGWWGKLAWLGDFAHRRLDEAWLQRCDPWLSQALRGSREQLAERWLEVYLNAPVLRMAWAPGVVDGRWWFGLLMPSCDSVGRYFPLLIAQARERPPLDGIALDHLELWYTHLARAATDTLAEGASLESFEAALADAPPWPTPGQLAPVRATQADGVERFALARPAGPAQWLHGLAAHDLQARLAGCSVWWRSAEGGARDSISVVRGLPDSATLVELLSGGD